MQMYGKSMIVESVSSNDKRDGVKEMATCKEAGVEASSNACLISNK